MTSPLPAGNEKSGMAIAVVGGGGQGKEVKGEEGKEEREEEVVEEEGADVVSRLARWGNVLANKLWG